MSKDDYEIFGERKQEQQARREERRPRYLQYAIKSGIPWRWLNEPYQIRFGTDDNFVDFFTTHAIVAFKGSDNKLIYQRGFEALQRALHKKGLAR
jgi:hypothetical protein